MSILAVDVDICTVATDLLWFDYLNQRTQNKLTMPLVPPYNLATLFPDISQEEAFDFWRSETLYDNLSPLPGSQAFLLEFHKQGWEVIFVSALKGNHHKSKYNCLEKHFPFLDGFIGTKEKNFVRCDIIIDDRRSYFKGMGNEVTRVLKWSPYKQESLEPFHLVMDKWETTDPVALMEHHRWRVE